MDDRVACDPCGQQKEPENPSIDEEEYVPNWQIILSDDSNQIENEDDSYTPDWQSILLEPNEIDKQDEYWPNWELLLSLSPEDSTQSRFNDDKDSSASARMRFKFVPLNRIEMKQWKAATKRLVCSA